MRKEVYQGKAKTLHTWEDPGYLTMTFRDDVTAYNGEKHAAPKGKGELNCQINTLVMEYLAEQGVVTHFVRQLSSTTALVESAKVLPVESVFRNRVAGSFMKKYSIELGATLANPVFELCVKNDSLGDPLIADTAVTALGMLTSEQFASVRYLTMRVNLLLGDLFGRCGYQLIDGKLEFGLLERNGELALVDEFTPDSCRLWAANGDRLDKDLFREDLGDLVGGYAQVYQQLCAVLNEQAV